MSMKLESPLFQGGEVTIKNYDGWSDGLFEKMAIALASRYTVDFGRQYPCSPETLDGMAMCLEEDCDSIAFMMAAVGDCMSHAEDLSTSSLNSLGHLLRGLARLQTDMRDAASEMEFSLKDHSLDEIAKPQILVGPLLPRQKGNEPTDKYDDETGRRGFHGMLQKLAELKAGSAEMVSFGMSPTSLVEMHLRINREQLGNAHCVGFDRELTACLEAVIAGEAGEAYVKNADGVELGVAMNDNSAATAKDGVIGMESMLVMIGSADEASLVAGAADYPHLGRLVERFIRTALLGEERGRPASDEYIKGFSAGLAKTLADMIASGGGPAGGGIPAIDAAFTTAIGLSHLGAIEDGDKGPLAWDQFDNMDVVEKYVELRGRASGTANAGARLARELLRSMDQKKGGDATGPGDDECTRWAYDDMAIELQRYFAAVVRDVRDHDGVFGFTMALAMYLLPAVAKTGSWADDMLQADPVEELSRAGILDLEPMGEPAAKPKRRARKAIRETAVA